MNLTAYKQLVELELWMYDTTELLDSGVTDTLSDFFTMDKSMHCSTCTFYTEITSGDTKVYYMGCANGCYDTFSPNLYCEPVDAYFCYNRWESV